MEQKTIRDLDKHLVVAYSRGFALIPSIKLSDGLLEFVEHKGTPPAPAISFAQGESDIYLADNYQMAYKITTVPIAIFGGLYLLVSHDNLDRIRKSRMVQGLLTYLAAKHSDLMVYPKFALVYPTVEDYKKSVDALADIYNHKDMD
ncbi:MAG: hypothetical protein WCG20_03905 [bacterium]